MDGFGLECYLTTLFWLIIVTEDTVFSLAWSLYVGIIVSNLLKFELNSWNSSTYSNDIWAVEN